MNKLKVCILILLIAGFTFCAGIFAYNVYRYTHYIYLDGELISKTDVDTYEKILKEKYKVFDNDLDSCVFYNCSIKDNKIYDYSVVNYEQRIDYDKLASDLAAYNEKARYCRDAYIDIENGHYIVIPEITGNTISADKLIEDLQTGNVKSVNMVIYEDRPNIRTTDLQPTVDELNKFIDWSVTYANGFTIRSSIDNVTNGETGPVLNDSFIDTYADQLEEQFDTVGKTKPFTTVDGIPIEVTGGTWGDTMDTAAELAEIKRLFNEGTSQVDRQPVYIMQMGDIGTSYVEISLERQHMWYIKDDVSIFDTPVVTGNVSTGRATKPGFYYMLEHTRNHWMRGDDYLVLATWWMRLTWGGVGIHDAPSRSAFGGDIYQYNGSHGCINTPPNKVAELFELTDVMTPVIIY